jgi:hypothetical protein
VKLAYIAVGVLRSPRVIPSAANGTPTVDPKFPEKAVAGTWHDPQAWPAGFERVVSKKMRLPITSMRERLASSGGSASLPPPPHPPITTAAPRAAASSARVRRLRINGLSVCRPSAASRRRSA